MWLPVGGYSQAAAEQRGDRGASLAGEAAAGAQWAWRGTYILHPNVLYSVYVGTAPFLLV